MGPARERAACTPSAAFSGWRAVTSQAYLRLAPALLPWFSVSGEVGGGRPRSDGGGDVGCKEWGPEGGTQAVGAAPSPPHRQPGQHWFTSLPHSSFHSLTPLPSPLHPPPLSSPSPSPFKRAGSALAPCSRRTVRAGGAVSKSYTQRPARQSGRQGEQSGSGSGEPGDKAQAAQAARAAPHSLTKPACTTPAAPRTASCGGRTRYSNRSLRGAGGSLFSLLRFPLHFYSRGFGN